MLIKKALMTQQNSIPIRIRIEFYHRAQISVFIFDCKDTNIFTS